MSITLPRPYVPLKPNPFPIPLVYSETGGGGNCQFTSLSTSLFPLLRHSADQIRRNVASQVYALSHQSLQRELKQYRNERNFMGNWSRYSAKTHDDLAGAIAMPIITKNYWDFQGDDLTLFLFADFYQTKVILFTLPHGTIREFGDYSRCCLLLYHDYPPDSRGRQNMSSHLGARHYQSVAWDQGSNLCQSVFLQTPSWLKRIIKLY